ncbi:MAG: 30S ribosomal protein S17 [Nitrospinota bacterium]|jgi:small subunit ribosomal protein S17
MDKRFNRKIRAGTVVSDKMDKTIVVSVERFIRHPIFKKTIKTYNKFKVHDEKNECSVGDKIKIIETRPLSKEKRWRLLEIVERASG